MSFDESKRLLGTLISHKKGYAFKSKDYVDKGVPVVRVSNFSGDTIIRDDLKFISAAIAETNSDVRLNQYDIVIATVGSWPNNPASVVGKTISVPSWAQNALMNQNSVIIRAKSKSIIDQKFIYYQLKSKEFSSHIISKAQGSANQASITLESIFSYEVCWPPEPIRRSVTEVLANIDSRIALIRETNTTLEAIAQALFKSWFVDFDPVHAKQQGREPEGMDAATATLFPDSFEESELGLVPTGWGVRALTNFCSISSGKRPIDRSDVETHDTNIPLYGGAGIMGFTSSSLFSEAKVVTGRVGTLGKVHIAYPPFWASDNVLVLTPNEDRNFLFCFHWLKSIDVHSMNRGSTQPLLTQKDLGNQKHALPTNGILNIYEEISAPLYTKIRLNSQKIQTFADLRDTLLPRLISGQLRLPEAESLLAEVLP